MSKSIQETRAAMVGRLRNEDSVDRNTREIKEFVQMLADIRDSGTPIDSKPLGVLLLEKTYGPYLHKVRTKGEIRYRQQDDGRIYTATELLLRWNRHSKELELFQEIGPMDTPRKVTDSELASMAELNPEAPVQKMLGGLARKIEKAIL